MSEPSYRFVPVQGGRWMIVSDDNQAVLGDRDFPSKEVAADALAEFIKGEGNPTASPRGAGGVFRRSREAEQARLPVRITITVSAEFRDMLDRLSLEADEDRAEVLRKALGLLRIARDAKREGNGIAIVTPDLEVDQEITGF